MNGKVAVAMSGGVDSSVAAWLLKDMGYDCVGVTMHLFESSDEAESSYVGNAGDARAVCTRLGMEHHLLDLSGSFEKQVIDRFVAAYECGKTPNPCVDCNKYLKFGELLERSMALGCDSIATGHYARIEKDASSGRFLLKKALDPQKDQSYFLYSLSQSRLARVLFPLGGMSKSEVKQIAEEQGFASAKKQESQDICFIGSEGYAEFISRRTGKDYPAGNFIDSSGRVLGRHGGVIRYTIGQRKGLGIAAAAPLYVCSLNTAENTVTLGKSEELFTSVVTANNINLISIDRIERPLRVKARIRYRHTEQWATVTQADDDVLRVEFDEPQRAVTAGQAVVLYDGDIVVGGGTII